MKEGNSNRVINNKPNKKGYKNNQNMNNENAYFRHRKPFY